MNGIARVFFFLATAIVVLWGAVEILLRWNTSTAGEHPVCALGPAKAWKNTAWIRTDADGVWVLDRATGALEWRTPQLDAHYESAYELKARFPLICKTPDYHCLISPDAGWTAGLRVPVVAPPFALVLDPTHPDGLHPFLLSAPAKEGTVRRAQPLRFCGRNFADGSVRLRAYGGRLVAVHARSGQIGVWNLGAFNGATSRDAGRAPDEIWQARENGDIFPADCSAQDLGKPLRFLLGEKHLIAHFDFAQSSEFRMWSVNPSIAPAAATGLAVGGASVVRDQAVGPGVAWSRAGKLLILDGDAWRETAWSAPDPGFFAYRGAERAPSGLVLTARRFLSVAKVSLVTPEKIFDVPWDEGLAFMRKSLPALDYQAGEGDRGILFAVGDKDITLRNLDCAKAGGSLSPTGPAGATGPTGATGR